MVVTGTSRAWRVGWFAAAAILCSSIAWGFARSPDLQFELGYAYESGQLHGWSLLARNHTKAVYWLNKAAQANHPRAQYMLGILYAHGWGVPGDPRRSVDWFTRSAQNGYGPACYHLGWMYHKGDGVSRNEDEARRLLEQAAAQGMAAAHLALGRFHARGEGVPVNEVEALKWYALAMHFVRAEPGLFDNAAFAERTQAAYAALALRMGPSPEAQGQAQAHLWLASQLLQRTTTLQE